MFSKSFIEQAKQFSASCKKHSIKVATAESCTGGLIASLLTEIPGSSEVLERGFITYSNEAKQELLGVAAALIKKHGAVSGQVAKAMAQGAIQHSYAQLSMAVTGIAGPAGGSKAKPVGLVYIACSYGKRLQVEKHHFKGSRTQIRKASVVAALNLAEMMLPAGK